MTIDNGRLSRVALENIAKAVTAFNANFVQSTNQTNDLLKEIVEQLKISNEPMDELDVEDSLERLREYKAATEDIAFAAERINQAIPDEPKWNVGDKVRVIAESSPWYGDIGTIAKKTGNQLSVEFASGEKCDFFAFNLHHMGAHLKPAELSPEWKYGAQVRVIDKHTILYNQIGYIKKASPTEVDASFGDDMTSATFHPSQLELIELIDSDSHNLEGMGVLVVAKDHDYTGREGTIFKLQSSSEHFGDSVEVMMHDGVHRMFKPFEVEILPESIEKHVCIPGCSAYREERKRNSVAVPEFDGRIGDSMRRISPTDFQSAFGNRPLRPMPSTKELDDFIGWVFEEAGRQGIDPKDITFVQGTQEGEPLMRMKDSWTMSPQESVVFEIELPKGVEAPTPTYMEEHFGHLPKPERVMLGEDPAESDATQTSASRASEYLTECKAAGEEAIEIDHHADGSVSACLAPKGTCRDVNCKNYAELFVGSESWLRHTEVVGHKTVTDCNVADCSGPDAIDKHDDSRD